MDQKQKHIRTKSSLSTETVQLPTCSRLENLRKSEGLTGTPKQEKQIG